MSSGYTQKNKTRVTASSSRKYTVGIAIRTDMVWPRQRVDAIRLASTDEIALGISSHHNFRTGYLEEEQQDRFCREYRPENQYTATMYELCDS